MHDYRFATFAMTMLISASTIAAPTLDGSTRSILQERLSTYVQALHTEDTATLKSILSTELLSRIEMRAGGTNMEERLKMFASSERQKLVRAFGSVPAGAFAVESMILHGNTVVAVSLSLMGTRLPKPFYFVVENAEYKINVIAPSSEPALTSTSYYLVQNMDYMNRDFSCSDYGPWTIAPYPATLKAMCRDTCPGWFDGSRFYANGGSADCDYNTWGIDAYIQSGYVVCHDRC